MTPVCAVCGQGGYWVAWFAWINEAGEHHAEHRCVNHLEPKAAP